MRSNDGRNKLLIHALPVACPLSVTRACESHKEIKFTGWYVQNNEKWPDDMQIKLSDVCKAYNWGLKQTSALAAGTRSFAVKHGSKSITVLTSSLISTRIGADVILEQDVEYDKDQIHTLLR